MHEVPLDPTALPPRSATSFAARRRSFMAAWLEPWHHPNFRWVFLTRASVIMGLTLFLTFIEYYFASVAHIPNFVQETAALALLALLGAATTALILGFLSDRIGRVWLVCGATACMALAALSFVVLPNIPLWPLGLLFGFGYGAYTSVDWALAVDVLPSRESAGKDMGIWQIASNLPAILAPLAGSAAIALASLTGNTAVGYRAVFALAVLCLVSGAVFILKVRDDIASRERQVTSARLPGPRVARHTVAPGWRLATGTGAGKAHGFLRFWPIWNRVMLLTFPTKRIPGASADIFRIHMRRYPGASIELPDGTRIARGDGIGELHLNNPLVVATILHRSFSVDLLRMPRSDLRALARWLADSTNAPELRALYGVSLLGPIGARLGFTLRPRRLTIHHRLERFFMMGLLALYHPRGLSRLTEGTTYRTYPVEVWMSRDELLRLYGEANGVYGREPDARV
ncbi:MAG: MFS transporter [Ktedonobacterales bacterium]